jgi:hypothetical protein
VRCKSSPRDIYSTTETRDCRGPVSIRFGTSYRKDLMTTGLHVLKVHPGGKGQLRWDGADHPWLNLSQEHENCAFASLFGRNHFDRTSVLAMHNASVRLTKAALAHSNFALH